MAKAGMLDEIDPWYWVYLAAFILSCTLGILVQCNTLKKKIAKNKSEETDGVEEDVEHPEWSDRSEELEAPLVDVDDASDQEAGEDDNQADLAQREDSNNEDQEGTESSEVLAIECEKREEKGNEQDE